MFKIIDKLNRTQRIALVAIIIGIVTICGFTVYNNVFNVTKPSNTHVKVKSKAQNGSKNKGNDNTFTGTSSSSSNVTQTIGNDNVNDNTQNQENDIINGASTQTDSDDNTIVSMPQYDAQTRQMIKKTSELNVSQDQTLAMNVIKNLATYDHTTINTSQWLQSLESTGANLALAAKDTDKNLLYQHTTDEWRSMAARHDGMRDSIDSISAGNPYCDFVNNEYVPVVPVTTTETTNQSDPIGLDWQLVEKTNRTYLVYLTQDEQSCYKVIMLEDDMISIDDADGINAG